MKSLKLYAPSKWENGFSLNYFIPQDDCCISKILSYDFCKGMVTRSLADEYSNFIFRDLLGWKANYVTSSGSSSASVAGSTSLLMPYNGTISFDDNAYGIISAFEADTQRRILRSSVYENNELIDYIYSFHPFLYSGDYIPSEGTSISILKKDGSWDLVQCFSGSMDGMPFYMSDWDFHFDESQYARTIDGYLRARITTKKHNSTGTGLMYNSKFFVVDYLPQKVNLSYAFVSSETRSTSTANNVRIYFSNTEGINRIVLEKLRSGSRVPSKIEVTDFKKGYYETTIDQTLTFTAVGYNDNGISRGLPITIAPTNSTSLNFIMNNNIITFNNIDNPDVTFQYTICSLDSSKSNALSRSTKGEIDISSLGSGLYLLSVTDNETGLLSTYKFKI